MKILCESYQESDEFDGSGSDGCIDTVHVLAWLVQ